MNTKTRKVVAFLAAFALLFTSLPAMAGSLDVHAVSAPAKVTGVRMTGRSTGSISISWNKIKKNKNTKGYTVYRNGYAVGSVGKGTSSFRDSGLRGGTTYSYCVRAYNTYKQKQWYNKKTGQWQKKKPARKYRGKSRKVTLCKYGKASSTICAATLAPPPPKMPLPAPTGLTATSPSAGKLIVTWDAVSGASFKLYVTGRSAYSTTGTSFRTEGLPAGTYTCQLEYSKDGQTSPKASVTVTVQGSGSETGTDNGSGNTTTGQTMTDYLGTVWTVTEKNGDYYTLNCSGQGSVLAHRNELARYDRTKNGEFRISGGVTMCQKDGATFNKDQISAAVFDATGSLKIDAYNADPSKIGFAPGSGITIEPLDTYSYNFDGATCSPVRLYYLVKNGHRIALTYEDPVSVEQDMSSSQYTKSTIRLRILREGDAGTGAGYGLGIYNDTISGSLTYNGSAVGTFEKSSCTKTLKDGMYPRRRLALSIAEDAIGSGSGDLGTDLRGIAAYIENTYCYEDEICGYGWSEKIKCTTSTYILETWAIYKYGDAGCGFAGWGSSSAPDHIAFHLNSSPNQYWEVFYKSN